MAEIVERIARHVVLDARQRAGLEIVDGLESARLATSFLFETDVNAEPDRAEERFVYRYDPLAPSKIPSSGPQTRSGPWTPSGCTPMRLGYKSPIR